jgi:hypothetical protein
MRHHRKMTGLVVIAASLLALGLAGIAQAGVARHATTANVIVTFTDTKLGLSMPGLAAGTTTFVVVNKGKKQHFLEIAGPGLKGVHTQKLAPGRTVSLTVKLRTGSYMLSDPVGLRLGTARWLQVLPASAVTSRGNGSVVAPPAGGDEMCGVLTP